MRALRKLLELPPPERQLLARAVVTVGIVRLALWLVPFPSLERVAARQHMRRGPRADPDRIAWAVRAAARYVPGATCLTQALAGRVLLARAGRPAHIVLGVARADGGALRAHAWVELDGRVILGDEGRDEYTPLPALRQP